MKTFFSKKFKKNYAKRIAPNTKLDKQFEIRYRMFVNNPAVPTLKDHPLTGKLEGYRAISISGDIRAIYYIKNDTAYFTDIGSHNQVYS